LRQYLFQTFEDDTEVNVAEIRQLLDEDEIRRMLDEEKGCQL
jgi:hypothetical protein